jgi:hypothetical protein
MRVSCPGPKLGEADESIEAGSGEGAEARCGASAGAAWSGRDGRLAARPRAPAAARGELGTGAAAVVSVGASMALARVTCAGHAKHPVRDLSIPQPLYKVVQQNLLQAGIVAPATAPPDATTSTS